MVLDVVEIYEKSSCKEKERYGCFKAGPGKLQVPGRNCQKQTVVINTGVGMSYVYAKLYAPSLSVIFVGDSWTKPKSWAGKNVLFVTPADTAKRHITELSMPHARRGVVTTPGTYHTQLYTIWSI